MPALYTMRDIGALVRARRRTLGWTQAHLAERLGVGRDWVVRLEQGSTRLESQKVLDALVTVGAVPVVSDEAAATETRTTDDPFADVFESL